MVSEKFPTGGFSSFDLSCSSVKITFDPSSDLVLGKAPWVVGNISMVDDPLVYPYVNLSNGIRDSSADHIGNFNSLIDGSRQVFEAKVRSLQ